MNAGHPRSESANQEVAVLVKELVHIATRASLKRGKPLFRCGDVVSGIYVIHSGAVRMRLDGADEVFPPRILGPGEIVGLPATLTGTYSLSAEVTEDAELSFVPARMVRDLLECSPRLCMVTMRLIGEEIARTRSALREGIPHLAEGSR